MEKKKIILTTCILLLAFILGGAFFVVRYLAIDEKEIPFGVPQSILSEITRDTSQKEVSKKSVNIAVERVVTGLSVPWSMVFTDPNRMLITERAGRVRIVRSGVLQEDPIHVFTEVVSTSEEGLMGLALDPDYSANKWIYVSLAYEKNGKLAVKVMRFRDEGDHLSEPFIVMDDIPAAEYHAGSRIKFGPDKLLYITTGDATDKNIAQDLKSLGGKILRINADGSVPRDNPFLNSPVWSYGHRNSQGIAWHPKTQEMYATEHGPSVFDGPAGGDEVNHILQGKNYGWPLVSHERSIPEATDPLSVFTPAVAPAGADFYTSSEIPQFENQLFFAALKGEGVFRVKIDAGNPDKIVEYEKLKEVQFGRIRDVIMGPDGALYFMTSNRDGRGAPVEGDDRIFRIVKQD